jgi:hypothetical protein
MTMLSLVVKLHLAVGGRVACDARKQANACRGIEPKIGSPSYHTVDIIAGFRRLGFILVAKR